MRLLLVAGVAAVAGCGWLRDTFPPGRADLVIRDVTVVDVESGRLLADRTVTIRGNRILAVDGADADAPAHSVIEGSGKFLIPGLWDSSTYVLSVHRKHNPAALALLVAHGVLGARDIHSDMPAIEYAQLKHEIERGVRLGPRLIWSGRGVDGPGSQRPGIVVRTPEDVRQAVAELKRDGVDFVQFSTRAPPDLAQELVAAAAREGLRAVGNVCFGYKEAADLGVHGIDHFVDLDRTTSTTRADVTRFCLDEGYRQEILGSDPAARDLRAYRFFAEQRSRRDAGYYTETLQALARRSVSLAAPFPGMMWSMERFEHRNPARARFRPHAVQEAMESTLEQLRLTRNPGLVDERGRQGLLDDLRDLHAAGVPILAATQLASSGYSAPTPGLSLHDGLQLFVEAGLSPLDALRAATLNPARFLGRTGDLGSVAAGKLADLVLLDGDPLLDIRNTARVHAVIFNGRALLRPDLDRILAEAEALVRQQTPAPSR